MERQMQTNLDELKELVQKHDGQGGIFVLFTKDGYVETHTYGKTKKQCNVLGRWWKDIFNQNFTAIPLSTIFGWGNGGVPKKITADEWCSLSANGAKWALSLGLNIKDDLEPIGADSDRAD